jgi:hypothetical protein
MKEERSETGNRRSAEQQADAHAMASACPSTALGAVSLSNRSSAPLELRKTPSSRSMDLIGSLSPSLSLSLFLSHSLSLFFFVLLSLESLESVVAFSSTSSSAASSSSVSSSPSLSFVGESLARA